MLKTIRDKAFFKLSYFVDFFYVQILFKFYLRMRGASICSPTNISKFSINWPHQISIGKNSILENNLVLIYTGIHRTAHKIAASYTKKLTTEKKIYINKIISLVDEGEKLINSGSIDGFGELLNNAWHLKKKLSNSITNKKIDQLYQLLIKNGAMGGKLLGAGGGGFLLMYVEKKFRKKFLKKLPNLINIPFKFSSEGSKIIFKNLER